MKRHPVKDTKATCQKINDALRSKNKYTPLRRMAAIVISPVVVWVVYAKRDQFTTDAFSVTIADGFDVDFER